MQVALGQILINSVERVFYISKPLLNFVASQSNCFGKDLVAYIRSKAVWRTHVNFHSKLVFQIATKSENVEWSRFIIEINEKVDITRS